jgi:hypothetical protein
MNTPKDILLDSKETPPKDISKDIADISPSNNGETYLVQFKGKETVYPYKATRIGWYRFSHWIDTDGYHVYCNNSGQLLRNIKTIAAYQKSPKEMGLYRVTFENGKSYDCPQCDILFTPKASQYPPFRYLREVCRAISETGKRDDPMKDYYNNQYTGIDSSMNIAELALGCYVSPEVNPPTKYPLPESLIFPFGLNLSQIVAVENALASQLSVIEGPPGTGKTQTILNIIANLVVRGNSVLVVSPNNSATDNVVEKLREKGYGFLVARLGNSENTEAFIGGQEGRYPDNLQGFAAVTSVKADTIARDLNALHSLFEAQRDLHTASAQLAKARLQLSYFKKEHSEVLLPRMRRQIAYEKISASYKAVHGAIARYHTPRMHLMKGPRLSLLDRLRISFIYGIENWAFYREDLGDVELSLFRLSLEQLVGHLEKTCETLQAYLNEQRLDELTNTVAVASENFFKASLYERYGHTRERVRFNDLREDDPVEFRGEYPVVTSTIDAAFKQLGKHRLPYDYVIIDESSQANVVKGALALASAKNAVVVGDVNQLNPVIDEKVLKAVSEPEAIGGCEKYRYSEHSLLSSLVLLNEDKLLEIPRQMLREHYRCDPRIIGFCNEKYYNNELIVMTADGEDVSTVLKAVYTQGANYDRSGDYNRRQAEDFYNELAGLQERYPCEQVGVATPYRDQVKGMKEDARFDGIHIDTIHRYQGREKDVIAFITRKNSVTSFLDDPNLVNVAVSRAKECLMVFVADTLMQNSGDSTNNIAELVRYIQYQGGSVVASSVASIYDILADGVKLRKVLQGARGTSLVPSERLTEDVLIAILDERDLLQTIDYALHYPLNRLFCSSVPQTEREKAFLRQGSHIDIIVYRKMDRHPLFGVEIDGAQHFSSKEQRERDDLKRAIFKRAGLTLLELPTHGSNEQDKLETCLENAIEDSHLDVVVQHLPQPVVIPKGDDAGEWAQCEKDGAKPTDN